MDGVIGYIASFVVGVWLGVAALGGLYLATILGKLIAKAMREK